MELAGVRTLGSAQGLTKNTPPMVPVLGSLLIAMLWANACQPAPNRAVGTQDERKTPNAGRTLVIIAGGELATFAGLDTLTLPQVRELIGWKFSSMPHRRR